MKKPSMNDIPGRGRQKGEIATPDRTRECQKMICSYVVSLVNSIHLPLNQSPAFGDYDYIYIDQLVVPSSHLVAITSQTPYLLLD